MNAFDFFFENTSDLDDLFLAGKEEISFKDLYHSCIDLAIWLEENIGQKKHVIILSDNNVFFIKAYLAILKSGNICIPLDPGTDKDTFEYIFNIIKPELIFLTREVDKKLKLFFEKSLFPDTLPKTSSRNHIQISKEFDPENCAEIIFTSGSTGKAKGVMISHKNLIANTSSIIEYLKITREDRMLVVLPFYYCYGLSLFHTHLRVGGSLVLNNSFIFIGGVIKDLMEYKCTGFAGVPSHFQILLRKSDSFKRTYFPFLRYVTQAGGHLAPVFIDEFIDAHPEIKFYVMYGQTEATARLSWLPPEMYEQKRGSIGKGIPGVDLKVVNKMNENVKPGETGEIIARGNNIMMGYIKDKKETKKTIRNGWLYTGDLGTIDEDGYIYLTARSKEIIKVRGRRISPKEIETIILEIPEVIDCAIEGIEDEIEGEVLKATIILKKGSKERLNEKMIQLHCSKHLALYRVPSIFVINEDINISPTGKKIHKKTKEFKE